MEGSVTYEQQFHRNGWWAILLIDPWIDWRVPSEWDDEDDDYDVDLQEKVLLLTHFIRSFAVLLLHSSSRECLSVSGSAMKWMIEYE